ncbi:PEP-CTERM sorting domain-containing protein [Nostoc sp.]|uniref:PEP-CTERM sorting domain-containing protein n=1 Tax=Nostoc sp. TaxID=1180 RepID=UPI002FF97702
MTKNNRKKAVAQAISTAVALGWVIMQVESAQAATLTVNNLDDSGFGSLRDAINTATSNDVVEFLLGSNPSTINLTSGALAIAKNLTINGPGANLLTISSNNQFPVFDISGADVKFYGLAIAGNINAYNSKNLTFTNSTVSGDNFKIDSNLRLINTTISSNNNIEINASDVVTLTDHSHLVSSNNTEINTSKLIVQDYSSIGTSNGIIINSGTLNISTANLGLNNNVEIKAGNINSGSAGNITISSGTLILKPGAIISKPVPEPSAIAAGSNHSGVGGNITLTTNTLTVRPDALILKPVPQPSAIAAGSNHSGAGGNITLTIPDLVILKPVRKPSAIADDSNNSGLGGNITISAPNGFIISKPVPEPSAIAGTILAGSLAWLVKRKQAAFRKVKV